MHYGRKVLIIRFPARKGNYLYLERIIPERNSQMFKNIVVTVIVIILILTLGIINYLDSDRSLEWAHEEEMYPLNKVQKDWIEKKGRTSHRGYR